MSIVSAIAKHKMLLVSAFMAAFTGACSNASNDPTSAEPAAKDAQFAKKQTKTANEQDPIAWDTLDVSSFFTQESNGTFILRDAKTQRTYVFNEERAKTRQAPQSTFKIVNALIGLQTGAVEERKCSETLGRKKMVQVQLESRPYTGVRHARVCCVVLSGDGPGYRDEANAGVAGQNRLRQQRHIRRNRPVLDQQLVANFSTGRGRVSRQAG